MAFGFERVFFESMEISRMVWTAASAIADFRAYDMVFLRRSISIAGAELVMF